MKLLCFLYKTNNYCLEHKHFNDAGKELVLMHLAQHLKAWGINVQVEVIPGVIKKLLICVKNFVLKVFFFSI